jgi:hypothetical protein
LSVSAASIASCATKIVFLLRHPTMKTVTDRIAMASATRAAPACDFLVAAATSALRN